MRQSWDETWMRVAKTVSQRSECVRRAAGAVIVSADQRRVATGYNGPPAGMKNVESTEDVHCRSDCPRAQDGAMHAVNDYSNCFAIHAEANAIIFSDRQLRVGGTIYMSPGLSCFDCAKLIANSGVSRVVAAVDPERDAHRADMVFKLWEACGIEFSEWTEE